MMCFPGEKRIGAYKKRTESFALALSRPSSLPFSGYIAGYQHLDDVENLSARVFLRSSEKEWKKPPRKTKRHPDNRKNNVPSKNKTEYCTRFTLNST